MTSIVQPASVRQIQRVLGNQANQVTALSQQQQSGISGQVPGLSNAWNTVAIRNGTLPAYPAPVTNGKMQTAGVGIDVLSNGANPVIRMGNLNIVLANGTAIAIAGSVWLDAAGNARVIYDDQHGFRFYETNGTFLGYPAYTSTSWW